MGHPRVDDHSAITCLLYAYCDAVDANETEQIVALFADDAIFDFGFGRIFAGRSELRRLFAHLDAYSATSHHLSNVVIEVPAADRPAAPPTRATARSRVHAFHRRADDGRTVHLWGVYTDVLVRDGGDWLIAHRTLRAAAELGADPAPGRSGRWEPIERRTHGLVS
jgi:ketosteroid isomerase-like protein